MKDITDLISEHKFFQSLKSDQLEFIAGCGKNVLFKKDDYIFKEGTPADAFFLIRKGEVALELTVPGKGAHVVETLGDQEVLGWSWIFPPYKWTYDCRAINDVRLTALNGTCLRKKCDEDHELGYELMKRFSQNFVDRLKAIRMQLMDLYGEQSV